MTAETEDQVRNTVRKHYAEVAESTAGVGCAPGCCVAITPDSSRALGYSEDELSAVPEGANLGLGCGNPGALAQLQEGERVLDLGSGGGFDCFLAAERVGPQGQVIGVDMTSEMVTKARANAERAGHDNVSFRLGEIEHLPVSDSAVDVIMSNCVINLSPNKKKVFAEAFRVLAPGGRLAISDVVALKPLPEALQTAAAHAGCIAGAVAAEEIAQTLEQLAPGVSVVVASSKTSAGAVIG